MISLGIFDIVLVVTLLLVASLALRRRLFGQFYFVS